MGNGYEVNTNETADVLGKKYMPALSIRQPWAWLIIHGKDIENRDWYTRFRGRCFVHAAKGCTKDEYEDAAYFAKKLGIEVPPLKDLERGGIVGTVEISDQ